MADIADIVYAGPRRRKSPLILERLNPFDRFDGDDDEIRMRYRFYIATIEYITDLFRLHLQFDDPYKNRALSPEAQVDLLTLISGAKLHFRFRLRSSTLRAILTNE
jgi:hypothetical protein